jgi:signal transduction histidine kinase
MGPLDTDIAPTKGRILGNATLGLLAIGFLALILMAVTSVILTRRNQEAFDLSTQTQNLLNDTARCLELIENAETGQRGFLLTERPSYLEPYTVAAAQIPDALDNLVNEAAPLTVAGLARDFRTAGLAKLTEVNKTIDLYRSDGRSAAIQLVDTDRGKQLMDIVRQTAGALRDTQRAQLTSRLATAHDTGRILVAFQVGAVVLVLMISILTGIGLYRNIKALHGAQAALARTNSNLEEIVAARTEALSLANDEIQKFAYIVSHDLRAPLVNIMGFTGELEAAAKTIRRYVDEQQESGGKDTPAPVLEAIVEDIPEAFKFIKTSTAKMDRLIGAILKLSREGRRVLTPEPLAMRGMVENIAGTLKHRTDEMGAEIIVEPMPDIISDRLAVEQIFSNLLDNAVKYLRPGVPGSITVSGVTKGPFAIFEVSDNGRGIGPGDRERVFELFRRAGEQNIPGEGIGLAYVRQLMYRLNGTIALESAISQGTTFKITLPLVGTKT